MAVVAAAPPAPPATCRTVAPPPPAPLVAVGVHGLGREDLLEVGLDPGRLLLPVLHTVTKGDA